MPGSDAIASQVQVLLAAMVAEVAEKRRDRIQLGNSSWHLRRDTNSCQGWGCGSAFMFPPLMFTSQLWFLSDAAAVEIMLQSACFRTLFSSYYFCIKSVRRCTGCDWKFVRLRSTLQTKQNHHFGQVLGKWRGLMFPP